MTGTVFDIQRFCIHDGPGIRTGVFLKGCPLSCAWCHNPESHDHRRQLRFTTAACIGCGTCLTSCPNGAHVMVDGEHRILRDRCERCFACTAACCAKALEIVGAEMSGQDVLSEVRRDKSFYDRSGGGLTLSGGEPFAQPDFTLEILRLAKDEGLHTCVETSGLAAREHLMSAATTVDLFLYDYKETDPELHLEFTGMPREPILENLFALDGAGATIVLRCPLVPGYNLRPDHLAGIARLSRSLGRCVAVEVLGYHRMGSRKLERLGMREARRIDPTIPDMSDAEVDEVIGKLRSYGAVNPRRA